MTYMEVRNDNEFAAAIIEAGSADFRINVLASFTTTDNRVIAKKTVLQIKEGAIITVGNGFYLNILGSVDLPIAKVFEYSGTGVVYFGSLHKGLYVLTEWFGAISDGTTDCTTAIQRAVTATLKGRIQFLTGSYLISSTITVASANNIVLGGLSHDTEHGGGTTIIINFSSAIPALTMTGFKHQKIEDMGFKVDSGASAAPSAILNFVDNSPTKNLAFVQLERLYFQGKNISDSMIAIKVNEAGSDHGDNISFRDVRFINCKVGVLVPSLQSVGLEFSKIHFQDVTYGLAFSDATPAVIGVGGGMVFGSSIQHTSSGNGAGQTTIYIRGAGNLACFSFANVTTENHNVILDASSAVTGGGRIVVNINGLRSSLIDRLDPIVKLGPATNCTLVSSLFYTSSVGHDFEVKGDNDNGDAILNVIGSYIGDYNSLSVDKNDYGFYKFEECFQYLVRDSAVVSNNIVVRNAVTEYAPNIYHTPMAPYGHFKMPLHPNNPGSQTNLRRMLPPQCIITRIIINITTASANSGYFQLRIPYDKTPPGGQFNANVAGIREIGLLTSTVQAGDTAIVLKDYDIEGGSLSVFRSTYDLVATGIDTLDVYLMVVAAYW